MADEVAGSPEAIAAILAALRRITDPQERTETAGRLSQLFATATQEAAEIRRLAIIEIYEQGKYSLKGLADYFGKSKRWADQQIPQDHPQRQEKRTR